MKIWPAIDIRAGRCVRLVRGDFADETVFGDPVEVAENYVEAGAQQLHVVDLDGAQSGSGENRAIISRIVERSGVLVQAGGGVRDRDAAGALFDVGVGRVVVGTIAATNRRQVEQLTDRWPGKVVAGLDYRLVGPRASRELAIRGWAEQSGVTVEVALSWLGELPLAGILATDIGRDGTAQGPHLTQYQALVDETDLPVIASGGVGSAADVAALAQICASGRRLDGVVVGRALLSGTLTIAEASVAAGNRRRSCVPTVPSAPPSSKSAG
jgi:phosphoribosylformimino-5-aminoimidazole carboxamide ribotide isomerase